MTELERRRRLEDTSSDKRFLLLRQLEEGADEKGEVFADNGFVRTVCDHISMVTGTSFGTRSYHRALASLKLLDIVTQRGRNVYRVN